jgi:hypothetical protein
MNKHSEKFLKQSLIISEGAVSELLKLIFLRGPLKRALKKLQGDIKTDPEMQASIADWEYHNEKLSKMLDEFCKKYPDRCKR